MLKKQDLKAKVALKIKELQLVAKKTFGKEVPNVVVAYDLTSVRVAGQAQYSFTNGVYKIRLHEAALIQFGDDYIENTVVHEFAHLVQFQHHFGSQPHGREWKAIMMAFGKDPKRCHDMDLVKAMNDTGVAVKTRKVKTFLYKCNCQTHNLTAIRHNKVLAGTGTYSCKKCKSKLVKA